MDRSSNSGENQCEQRHFRCASVATPAPPSVALQSCAQANQSLDTVRSLHQTVVSLRNALDDARREISNLKKQMTVQTVIEEGRTFKENDPGHKPIEEEKSSSSTVINNTGPKMGSQIDVKIRVSSNLNVSTSAVGEGSAMEESKSAPDSARSVVNIKLTSQEQLNVSQQEESLYTFNQSVNEEVQLDGGGNAEPEEEAEGEEEHQGRVSLIEEENSHEEHPLIGDDDEKSLSDGDNSVFGDLKEAGRDQDDYEEVEPDKHIRPKNTLHIPHQKLTRAHSDTQEEVDDIELIFSSDDHHRELHGEEMVSISSIFEPWQKPGSSGSPVLLSFEKFSLDEQEGTHTHQQQRRRKQISLDEGPRSVADKSLQKKISLDRDRAEDEAQQLAKTSLGNSKWQQQHKKELHVTDISKCGISEENIMDMGRRNTCPNPPVYRPVLSYSQRDSEPVPPRPRNSLSTNRCILGGKYTRPGGASVRGGGLPCSSPGRSKLRSPLIAITNAGHGNETGPKRSSSVQTDISALPDHWQSESHLSGACYANGLFTLPSKFNPLTGNGGVPVGGGRLGPHCPRAPLRPSQKTQEARRVLLSDINFTSMIPELSRSADHLCPDDGGDGEEGEADEEGGQENQEHDEDSHQHHHHHHHLPHRHHNGGHPGIHLQTPTMGGYKKGLTPSASINSHGSMNENSFATQTTQTGDYWVNKGDSFDSTSCYTNDSRLSLNRSTNSRSRSVPSIKCVYCKKSHGLTGMRTSESMNYTPRVVAIPESYATVKGSLPDLRHDCCCPQRYDGGRVYSRTYVGSTESLIDDSDVFIRHSSHSIATPVTPGAHFDYSMGSRFGGGGLTGGAVKQSRRCSENDLGKSYQPSKQSLPFLPKSANCLKIGHLAKVIARNGRVVVGQVRYVGPICNAEYVAKLDGGSHDTFIGLELPASGGDTDGTIEGKRFFYCEQNRGIFVPFPKVIMAWTS